MVIRSAEMEVFLVVVGRIRVCVAALVITRCNDTSSSRFVLVLGDMRPDICSRDAALMSWASFNQSRQCSFYRAQ